MGPWSRLFVSDVGWHLFGNWLGAFLTFLGIFFCICLGIQNQEDFGQTFALRLGSSLGGGGGGES